VSTKTRPGGPSGPGRSIPQNKPRIEAAGARGSFAGALSWRTAVLAVVVVLALAVLLPSLRVYFAQQENLRQLRAERDTATTEVDDLTNDLGRWDDPAYVVAQARERLAYVFPGETAYRVVDPELAQSEQQEVSGAIETPNSTRLSPWYTTLWDSIEEAGTGSDAAATP
jgi:cell division protein FtsB